MSIKEITSDYVSTYKAFFIRGLEEHPMNFRISPTDEANEPFPTEDHSESFTLGAYDNLGALMGVVSFKRELGNRVKCAHKFLLFRMYVAQENTSMGVGKALIDALLNKAAAIHTAEQINLTVIDGNIGAEGLYRKYGFEVYGLEKNSVKWEGQYLHEKLMVKFLKK